MMRHLYLHDWTLGQMLDLMLLDDNAIQQHFPWGRDTVIFAHGIIDTVSLMHHVSFRSARWMVISALIASDCEIDDTVWLRVDADCVDVIRDPQPYPTPSYPRASSIVSLDDMSDIEHQVARACGIC